MTSFARTSLFFAFASIFFGNNLYAKVIQTATMADALKDATTTTLVILDIDNTILTPNQMVGSDAWFDHLFATLKEQGKLTEGQAEAAASAIWGEVQARTAVRPVEAITPDLIAKLQAQGTIVMALTARPLTLTRTTLIQLKGVGINLMMNPVSKALVDVRVSLPTRPKPVLARYNSGVLFANGADKGKLLVAFLKQQKLKPSSIIFVDDKQYNADNVERALVAAHINHAVYRYSAADAIVKTFNGETADLQYFFMQHILSDADAALIQEKEPHLQKRWVHLEPWSHR